MHSMSVSWAARSSCRRECKLGSMASTVRPSLQEKAGRALVPLSPTANPLPCSGSPSALLWGGRLVVSLALTRLVPPPLLRRSVTS